MKRLRITMLVALVAVLAVPEARAVEDPFKKGSFLAGIQGGILPGFGSTVYGDYVLADLGKGHFTVGGQIGINRRVPGSWAIFSSKTNSKLNLLSLTARATYGLNLSSKLELHGGALIGVGFTPNEYKFTPGLAWGGLLGLRFFFTDNLALSFEPQYANYGTCVNLGLAFRF